MDYLTLFNIATIISVGFYFKKNIYSFMLRQMFHIIDKYQNSKHKTYIESYFVNDNDLSIKIKYIRHNEEHFIMIPFKRDLIALMSQFKAKLIKDDEEIDITQQPGLPYMCSAEQLGGKEIIITNEETGARHVYKHKIPLFAEEIME
jgi:hypothetical protein